jgi:hypothetical protein
MNRQRPSDKIDNYAGLDEFNPYLAINNSEEYKWVNAYVRMTEATRLKDFSRRASYPVC